MNSGALGLAFVVLFAFSVETTLGFGATVITLSFGAAFIPITSILPAIIPLNIMLSAFIAIRHRSEIERSILLKEILPLMALGLPLGLWIFTSLDEGVLKRTLGAFVGLLAARELLQIARRRAVVASPARSSNWSERFALILGGVAHGAFGTGGPLAVYALSRRHLDKGAFRATLSALWLLLNLALLTTYWLNDRFSTETFELMPPLAVGGAIGLLLGGWIFHRVPATTFRTAVYVLLFLVGLGLLFG